MLLLQVSAEGPVGLSVGSQLSLPMAISFVPFRTVASIGRPWLLFVGGPPGLACHVVRAAAADTCFRCLNHCCVCYVPAELF
jgi:hypothetical protein